MQPKQDLQQAVCLDPTSVALAKNVLRVAKSYVNRRAWHRAIVLRSTATALILRGVERALGQRYVKREKNPDRRWSVYAYSEDGSSVLFAIIGGGQTRKLEDLRAPLRIELIRPDLVDVSVLVKNTRGGLEMKNPQNKGSS